MLYLIATPIGNLGDMTFRAVEMLQQCDYVLCEDTRHSRLLLEHYKIDTPLKSFHKFSEASKEKEVLSDLQSGKEIALISDAGTPGISDPGTRLVKSCLEERIPVVSIPGPCAAIAALTCSGLDTDTFQFIGFLPRKPNSVRKILQEALMYSGTTICYESPQRLLKVLSLIDELSPDRHLVVARELTKKFEETIRGKAKEIIEHFSHSAPKGEIVLLIEKAAEILDWSKLTPEEHVDFLQHAYHLCKQEAIKLAAKQRNVPKREIYNKIIHTFEIE
jgi:16S rRNA (cytidine1402-2'-O)-methyltransferase